MITDKTLMLSLEERLELLKLSLEDDKSSPLYRPEVQHGIDLALSSLLIYVPELKEVKL